MSRHPQIVRDKAVELLKTGLDNVTVAGMVSAEFDVDVRNGVISSWRKHAGLPRGTRKVTPNINQPICRNYATLVKKMKPVPPRLKKMLEKSCENV